MPLRGGGGGEYYWGLSIGPAEEMDTSAVK